MITGRCISASPYQQILAVCGWTGIPQHFPWTRLEVLHKPLSRESASVLLPTFIWAEIVAQEGDFDGSVLPDLENEPIKSNS